MRSVQITIPEPCHEDWQRMTPTDQGRFCNACAKEVVDFSMMTDPEVFNYFSAISHEKICGRALPSQLNRSITMPKEPGKRLFWYWNYIVMFFMFFSKANVSKAQGNMQTTTELSHIKLPDINGIPRVMEGVVVPGSNIVKAANPNNTFTCRVGGVMINDLRINGKIKDDSGNPVSFATVKIVNSKYGVSADADGKFSIRIDHNKDTLSISASGYESKQVIVKNYRGGDIILKGNNRLLGEVVITSYPYMGGIRRSTTGEVKAEKKNTLKDTLKTLLTNSISLIKPPAVVINVYPNPVKRGSSLALSIKLKHGGNYNIDIIDASGRILLQKQTNILSKEYMEQVQTDSRWSSGVYYIRVFDNNNKSISKISFIVK